MQIQKTVELDIRLEDIDFRKIMETVQRMKEEQTLTLHVSFNPTPLFSIMKSKGFDYTTAMLGENHWKVDFYRKENNKHLNLIGYEINDIIYKIISSLENLSTGNIIILVHVIPEMVINYMNDSALGYQIDENSDGTYKITVKS